MSSLSIWAGAHVAGIGKHIARAPVISRADIVPVAADLDIWDAWPLQLRDGRPASFGADEEIWMALASPHFPDPDERHGHARIHLFTRTGDGWRHQGAAMPDGFSPGSREWSGSAIYDPEHRAVTLYFTAAGRRGEAQLSFEQRMFMARATLQMDGRCVDWRDLREIVQIDRAYYMPTNCGGAVGTIKAFRDPAYFRDPVSGEHYLFFAGSLACSLSSFNGVIGMATSPVDQPDCWQIAPPLISANGLNNELERPHVIVHDQLYYMFWSTQQRVFEPSGPIGPTGLYGMVSETIDRGWRPLNGTGLVFANPADVPAQAYSWMVLPDLTVTSFVDDWGNDQTRRFGGTFAPFLTIHLDGDRADLVGDADAA